MKIEEKDGEIVIRISKPVSPEQYTRLKQYLEHMEILSKSKATEEEIEKLVEEVKAERRERVLREREDRNVKTFNPEDWDEDIDHDAARLSEEMKSNWWKQNKHRFVS
jgi:hypothetical protein